MLLNFPSKREFLNSAALKIKGDSYGFIAWNQMYVRVQYEAVMACDSTCVSDTECAGLVRTTTFLEVQFDGSTGLVVKMVVMPATPDSLLLRASTASGKKRIK